MQRIVQSSPSLVISVIALFVAVSGTATALPGRNNVDHNDLRRHVVHTGKIHNGAVNSKKVDSFALRLHDLGGKTNDDTETVGSTVNVPPGQCNGRLVVESFNPAPKGFIGSLVVGVLTDDQGDAVLPNGGVVVPTMISETSQGGADANLMVSDLGSSGQTVPAGSVFHYQIIGPEEGCESLHRCADRRVFCPRLTSTVLCQAGGGNKLNSGLKHPKPGALAST